MNGPLAILAEIPGAVEAAWPLALRQMIYATVVFGVVLAVVALLARRPSSPHPTWLYALWSLVLLRLVLPVDLSAPFGVATLVQRAAAVVPVSVPFTESAFVPRPAAEPAVGLSARGAPSTGFAPSSPTLGRPSAGPSSPTPWPALLAGLWAAGSLGWGWRAHRRRRSWLRLARVAPELDSEPARRLLARWRRHYGIRRPVRLVSSTIAPRCAVPGPFTVGTRRPVVWVPPAIAERADWLDATLAHELAHVARFDDLRLCLQEALRAVWLPFPLVHLAVARMRFERERICDRRATGPGGLSRRRYVVALRSILADARTRGLVSPRSVPGLQAADRGLFPSRNRMMRFRSLLVDPRSEPAGPRRWLAGSAYLAVVALLLPMAPESDARPEAEAPSALESASIEEDTGQAAEATGEDATGSNAGSQSAPSGWIAPLAEIRVTSAYGPRTPPFAGQPERHTGIDLRADAGAQVRAPSDGVVELATERWADHEDWGTVLILDHGGGWRTFYAHLESVAVAKGDRVRQGQPVARVGSTGKSTGPHLHYELHRDGEAVDPAQVLPR